MISNKKYLDFYDMVLYLKKQLDKKKPPFIKSVFVYGSVSRGEMIPGLSDLDVMVIINKDALQASEINTLNTINKATYKKYPIHMTFRLRSPAEISEEVSTTNDFGPTSIWNYYFDSWYIYGEDLTAELIKKMKRSIPLVQDNIRERMLELRKNLRALYSIHTFQSSTTTIQSKERELPYKIGDLILELAQLVCWVHGKRFISSHDAAAKAAKLSQLSVFKYASDIKQSKRTFNTFRTYELLEKLFHDLLENDLNKATELFANQRFITRDTVGLILRNKANGKYLLLKHATIPNYWTFPKGGVQQGETFIDALKRELLEETHITKFIINGHLPQLNHTYIDKEQQCVKVKTHLFTAETTESNVVLSSEHTQFKWVTKKQFLNLSRHKINLLISRHVI